MFGQGLKDHFGQPNTFYTTHTHTQTLCSSTEDSWIPPLLFLHQFYSYLYLYRKWHRNHRFWIPRSYYSSIFQTLQYQVSFFRFYVHYLHTRCYHLTLQTKGRQRQEELGERSMNRMNKKSTSDMELKSQLTVSGLSPARDSRQRWVG